MYSCILNLIVCLLLLTVLDLFLVVQLVLKTGMSPIFARPISCTHNSEIQYDAEDVVPKYVCGCKAVILTRSIHIPLESASVCSTFTMPLDISLSGNPNLGATIPVRGWMRNERVRVVISFTICFYDENNVVNRIRNRCGYFVYCGRCYSEMENGEGDFEPEWTEDGYQAFDCPEAVCQLDVEYEDEVNADGTLYLQVEHRPGHVLATEEGIDAGLELARTIDELFDLSYSRETICAHCHCSIMRCSYL